eukprot:gene4966-8560_t
MAEKIKNSWNTLKEATPVNNEPPLLAFAGTFYGNLFKNHPEHKPLFKSTDMKEQGKKLVKIVGICVVSAENLEKLAATLDKLGEKHASFGVDSKQQFLDVKESLLFALSKHLGDEWNDELANLWSETYDHIMEIMIHGAEKWATKHDEKKKKDCIIL